MPQQFSSPAHAYHDCLNRAMNYRAGDTPQKPQMGKQDLREPGLNIPVVNIILKGSVIFIESRGDAVIPPSIWVIRYRGV